MKLLAEPAFWAVIFALFTFVLIVYGYLRFFDWYRHRAQEELEKIFDELEIEDVDQDRNEREDLNEIRFATYVSFLLPFGYQYEYQMELPPEKANRLLDRVFWHNLRWNCYSPFVIWILIASLITHFRHKS